MYSDEDTHMGEKGLFFKNFTYLINIPLLSPPKNNNKNNNKKQNK